MGPAALVKLRVMPVTSSMAVEVRRWGRRHPTVGIGLLLAALVLATLLCLPLRPLWVDEIYQLEATRDQSFPVMFHSAMVAPGGMPLAYAAQKLWLQIAGFSTGQARIPAAIFGLTSVWAMAWVARLLQVNAVLVAVLALVTPLLFRYSTEARPYSQGLFFSVLGTALFLLWMRRPSLGKLAAYSLCCVAGLYSQPFSIFVPAAHLAYLLLADRKRIFAVIPPVLVAGALYAPWFVLSSRALAQEAWPHLMFFSWHQIPPQVILRELSGGGYLCSLTLLVLACLAWQNSQAKFLLLWAIIPGLLAIAADARFNYFFAIRQLIFVLPPLLVGAALGLTTLWHDRRGVALVLACLYFGGALVKNVRWEMDRKEDWSKAASYLKDRLISDDECIRFEPDRDAPSYYFFQPSLRARTCGKGPGRRPALIAVSPYASSNERQIASDGRNVGNTLVLAP